MPASPTSPTPPFAGRYRIERALGSGGMATVYLAEDLRHRRKVAIKVLRPELSAALGRERFFKEIEVTAGLEHAHILPLFDSGEVPAEQHEGEGPSVLFYVMPYVEGGSLRERLRRERQLPLDEAIAIATDVADALSYACARGVVHRDVKPENILLRPTGAEVTGGARTFDALVSDFGIARALSDSAAERLTGTGVALGTPAYMSPEQSTDDAAVDCRTDVYALGCVTYEMLAGEPPYMGPTARSVIAKHLHDPVPDIRRLRERVPDHVALAIDRALSKVGADRFATARQFADALLSPGATHATPRSGARRAGAVDGASRRWTIGIAGSCLVAITAVVVALAADAGGVRTRASQRLQGVSASVADERRSIAVLPFDNVGGNPDEEYFSDGLTEELIAALSQLGSLRVAARTSSFAVKGQARDVREVGRALNVGTVLVGSVRKAENRIRVTAQLIDASTGLDLWSQVYDERELADVFDIQTDMARRIAIALETTLTPSDERRLAAKPTGNLEAYTLYLKGRYFWSKRDAQLKTAIEYFNRAIAIDSQYARAYAGLASAYGPLGVHGYIHPREGRERMLATARRALELDEGSAEAHTVLGAYVHVYEWDWDAAEREFRRAIQLDPNYPTAHAWYGHFLENMGRIEEALVERRLAARLDPLAPSNGVGWALMRAGRYAEAMASFREALEIDADYWQAYDAIGTLLILTGDFDGGVAAFERAVATSGGTPKTMGGLARALALAGRREEARERLRAIRQDVGASNIYHPDVAPALLALGDTTAAFEWLDASFRQRHPALTAIDHHPAYAGFRANIRFQDLLRRVGFPDSR